MDALSVRPNTDHTHATDIIPSTYDLQQTGFFTALTDTYQLTDSTELAATEDLITVYTHPADTKMLLFAILFTLLLSLVTIVLVSLLMLFKFRPNARIILRSLCRNLIRCITCKKRITNNNVTTSTCNAQVVKMFNQSEVENGLTIRTESVLDLSNLANGEDEDNQKETVVDGIDDDLPTNPVTVSQFIDDYYANDINDSQLRKDFDTIKNWSKMLRFSHLHAEGNKKKNRYNDILPFDYNRVPLYGRPGLKGFKPYHSMTPDERKKICYINASYIQGFGNQKTKYIATQGPMSRTITDFWNMIWQEESDCIVMLTSLNEHGKIKCERYWPLEDAEFIQCGNMTVKLEVLQKYAFYTYRRLQINQSGVSRMIHHYQYNCWPDKSSPEFIPPILNLHRKVFLQSQRRGPIIVHCSAGIGRTGTFIALDYLQDQAKQTNTIDILGCVCLLRKQRVNMVQTLNQYVFLHKAIHEVLQVGLSFVPSVQFQNFMREAKDDGNAVILKQFKLIDSKRPRPEIEPVGLDTQNRDKNRDLSIIPDQRKIVFLSTFIKGRNAYINAVYVDTFLERDACILTQLPMEHTICDFWRLINDSNSTTIVLLEAVLEDCPVYWPEDNQQVTYGDVMSVRGKLDKEHSNESVTVRHFNIKTKPECSYEMTTTMLQLKSWHQGQIIPPSIPDILELIQRTKQYKKNATTVQCLNGCDKSGLFCACMYIMDQIQIDKEVDIYQACRMITASRPQFMRTEEQYLFLHGFALCCLKTINTGPQLLPIFDNRDQRRSFTSQKKLQHLFTSLGILAHASSTSGNRSGAKLHKNTLRVSYINPPNHGSNSSFSLPSGSQSDFWTE